MDVMAQSPAPEFNFDSASTTPYVSAPSSPRRFGNGSFFYSAPASPARVAAFIQELSGGDSALSAVPFVWEEKPGIAKARKEIEDEEEEEQAEDVDFAFDFSGQIETKSLSADELFDGGKIKPLKPPPRFQYDQNKPLESPKSPKSPRSPKKMIKEAFFPRHHRRKEFEIDPFAAAMEHNRDESVRRISDQNRGRERTKNPSTSTTSTNKTSRSLSPFRVSGLFFHTEHNQNTQKKTPPTSPSSLTSFLYKKWSIKDLLLFRSASEGRATDKEQMKKYTLLRKKTEHQQEDMKNSSFRSSGSGGSSSSKWRKPGPPISAHELHYTMNRAVSEEMKKRTFLPYKQGLLGCLGFHPTLVEMSRGLSHNGSLSRASSNLD